jgi:hypothetical protein
MLNSKPYLDDGQLHPRTYPEATLRLVKIVLIAQRKPDHRENRLLFFHARGRQGIYLPCDLHIRVPEGLIDNV